MNLGVERIGNLLQNTLENVHDMKSLKQCGWLASLKEIIVDENKQEIFNNGYQKLTGQLNQSRFCYYTRDPVDVLKKQLPSRREETLPQSGLRR